MKSKYTIRILPISHPGMSTELISGQNSVTVRAIQKPHMTIGVIEEVLNPLDHKYLLLGGKFIFAPGGKALLVKTSDIHK